MVDRIGQQFGSYRLIRLLGRGGFAEVYLGEHVRLHNYGAVKLLNTSVTDNDAESFQREAHTIARLLHPHIVRVFDYDIADGMPFLIMDYAPNGTLRNAYPKGTRVPVNIIVSHVLQVANALQYAHNEKVIHRDIKPENMLLGRNNEVLLSDFGIATMAQSSRYQNTQAQDIVGTVAYMAPEQIQGKPHPASDQYSLAIVVYEWLSGERPFHGSFTEIAVQHVITPPQPLHERVPDIAPEIEQVMAIALAKNPHQRFANIQAFANALQQAGLSESAFRTLPGKVSLSSTTLLSPGLEGTLLSPAAETLTPDHQAVPVQPESFTVYANAHPDISAPKSASPPPTSPIPAPPTRPAQRPAIFSRRAILAGLVVIGGGLAAFATISYFGTHAKPPVPQPQPTGAVTTQVPIPPTSPPSTPTPTPTPAPLSGSWSSLPSLPSPEADNTAVYVNMQQQGYVYMTGGYHGRNYSPRNDNNLYRYNIEAGQWETVTNNFPGMFNNAVVWDGQNNLFLTGGYSSDNQYVTTLLYMYQLDTQSLQMLVPPAGISFGYGGSMIADLTGHLYLTQGFMDVYGSYTSAGTGWYRYDIASGQWNTLAALPQGVAYAVLAADRQGNFVLMGGATDTEQTHGTQGVYRYSIARDSWENVQAFAPIAFNGAASCDLGNGQVVVVGGYDPARQVALNSTWLIDLRTFQSRQLASLPAGGSRLGAMAYDGKSNAYLVRGVVNDPDQPTQDFWQLHLQ